MIEITNCNSKSKDECNLLKTVDVPIELYKSLQGKYFVGYADNLTFGQGTGAWGRLYNPKNSRVNLHVNVWTVSDISESPYRAEFWFNAVAPGIPVDSDSVTTSNFVINPLPEPKIKLQSASDVTEEPYGGVEAFIRIGQPGTTLVETENGKFIFPPGGSFMIFLSNQENPEVRASGRIAFGWWEEEITNPCIY